MSEEKRDEFDLRVGKFKQSDQKPLVSRVMIDVLVEAVSNFYNLDNKKSIIFGDSVALCGNVSAKAVLLDVASKYHYPLNNELIKKPKISEAILFAISQLINVHYPCNSNISKCQKPYSRSVALSSLNPKLLLEVGYRKTLGDNGKYEPGSWCMLDEETFLNGALRHYLKHDMGVIEDEDGGTHISAVVWNLTCLYWKLSVSDDELEKTRDRFKKFSQEEKRKRIEPFLDDVKSDNPGTKAPEFDFNEKEGLQIETNVAEIITTEEAKEIKDNN